MGTLGHLAYSGGKKMGRLYRLHIASLVSVAAFVVAARECAADSAVAFDSENGHYYQRIDTAVPWAQARDLAAAQSYLNRPGHLLTLTSSQELSFVTANLGGDAV